MTNEQLWQAVLGELEVSISRANFITWFKGTSISDRNSEKVIICVPNSFTHDWLKGKYYSPIIKALRTITGDPIRELIFKMQAKDESESSPSQAFHPTFTASNASSSSNTGFNPKYTFQNFIVGKGNELAHAACIAVSNKPGQIYNPLFIYGPSGLGKTHLIQATGQKIKETFQLSKLLYVSSEEFTNEYIHGIRTGATKSFQDKYRNIDVLLVDDIQFIEGKTETQEAFFHTFNTLHQANKQIVLTSDRPPKAIVTIEKRLLTRFEWGMIADVGNPDFETRVAILNSKCQEKNIEIDDKIIHFIANVVNNNIRELEGALNRIIADSQIRNIPPTIDGSRKLLASIISNSQTKSISPKQILHAVSEYFSISKDDIMGKSRKKELVVPRQITMFLMRSELNCSYPLIGLELGGKDHTTAMHSCEKIEKEVEENEKLRQDILSLRERLYSAVKRQ